MCSARSCSKGPSFGDSLRLNKIEYKDGKVILIRKDERGMVKKVIIMNSDGETVDVKEGKEAREFMIKNGDRSISSVS